MTGAHTFHESGNIGRAAQLADESLNQLRAGRRGAGFDDLHVLAWTLCALGRGFDVIDALPAADVAWVRAANAFAAGDLRRAAEICAEMGALTEEARDRLWLGKR